MCKSHFPSLFSSLVEHHIFYESAYYLGYAKEVMLLLSFICLFFVYGFTVLKKLWNDFNEVFKIGKLWQKQCDFFSIWIHTWEDMDSTYVKKLWMDSDELWCVDRYCAE